MDLKKPGFGGPKSAIALRDSRGSKIDKNPKLDGYLRTVERDPAFSHPVYDPTYKAMTNDLVYKQEKKKPFTYDRTVTGIPVVVLEPIKEGKSYTSFERFINETIEDGVEDEFDKTEEEDDEIYDPIRAAHSEYESPMDRRYDSQDWVDAQRDAEGTDDETEEEFDENDDRSDLGDIEDRLRSYEE